MFDRRLGSFYFRFLSVHENFSAVERIRAVNGSRKFRSARAHKPRKSENFAFSEFKTHVFKRFPADDVSRLEDNRSVVRDKAFFFLFAVNNPADHHFNDIVFGQVLRIFRTDVFAVPHNGHSVRYAVYLVHTVRNVYHSDILSLQIVHYAEKILNLGLSQRRGRFVENKKFRISRNGFGNFNHLLSADGERAEFDRRIDANAYAFEKFGRVRFHFPVVDKPAFHRFSADINILRDRKVIHHIEFLMNYAYARCLRFGYRREFNFFAEVFDTSRVVSVYSAKHFHQR